MDTTRAGAARTGAGPFDRDLIYPAIRLAQKRGMIVEERIHGRYFFAPGERASEYETHARDAIGDALPALDNLLTTFEVTRTDDLEAIATLYAAWNDFLLDGHAPADEEIITEVRENWDATKQRFTPAYLSTVLDGMRANGLVPVGRPPHTLPGSPQ